MKRIVIEEGSLPELVVKPKVRFDDTVLKALKEAKNGMTNHELCLLLKPKDRRRVSESISKFKDLGRVTQKLCRCEHAPIYYFYK